MYVYDLCKGKKMCSAGASKAQDENLPPADQEQDLAKRIVSALRTQQVVSIFSEYVMSCFYF